MDETYFKIIKRYEEIKSIVKDYDHISKVNNYKILKFDQIINFIKKFVTDNAYEDNFFYFFHGDLHLNNILIDPSNKDIKLIESLMLDADEKSIKYKNEKSEEKNSETNTNILVIKLKNAANVKREIVVTYTQ